MANHILRIYICGPHSTGKTTIVRDLMPHVNNIKVVDEVARGIIDRHGWARDDFVPQRHPDVFQQLNEEILAAQIEHDDHNTELRQDFICDRAIDPIVYTGFYVGDNARRAMFDIPGVQRWLERMRHSLVFLISPHRECIFDDNVRLQSDFEELQKFYAVFEQELKVNNIPYIKVTDLDRQQRVQQILEKVQEFKNKQGN